MTKATGGRKTEAASARTNEVDRVEFAEQFAEEMTRGGMNRMAARVFAVIASSDEGSSTASELGAQLKASPAAISGAVRYLEQVDMIRRTRPLGTRRDVFSLTDDMWYEALAARDSVIETWGQLMRSGVDQLGPESPAGQRMAVMADFFEFMQEEMQALLERWKAHRAERHGH